MLSLFSFFLSLYIIMSTTPRSNLLQEGPEDDYFNTKPSSYYKRGNLLSNTTSSFRQKCKRGFTRSRSSSYTSLDDEKQNEFLIEQQPAVSPSFFSRKKLTAAPETQMSPFDDDAYDEDSFLFENKYSRQAIGKRSTSWKSSVLKAVGVKSK
jgi:hypothetical protein